MLLETIDLQVVFTAYSNQVKFKLSSSKKNK